MKHFAILSSLVVLVLTACSLEQAPPTAAQMNNGKLSGAMKKEQSLRRWAIATKQETKADTIALSSALASFKNEEAFDGFSSTGKSVDQRLQHLPAMRIAIVVDVQEDHEDFPAQWALVQYVISAAKHGELIDRILIRRDGQLVTYRIDAQQGLVATIEANALDSVITLVQRAVKSDKEIGGVLVLTDAAVPIPSEQYASARRMPPVVIDAYGEIPSELAGVAHATGGETYDALRSMHPRKNA